MLLPIRLIPLAPALAAVAAIVGCLPERADHTPPDFGGIVSAVAVAPGTALLSWDEASDRSEPVTYRIWKTAAPGAISFEEPPIAETQSLSLNIAGLPVGANASWFSVRAIDAEGNEETNIVERSVVFAENRLELVGSYETPVASDIAVHPTRDLVAMGGFSTPPPQVRAWLFDVSDPSNPVLVTTILGEGRSTDVEISGDVLWVATENDPDDHGAYAYDITDAAAPVEVGRLSGPGLRECHTIWLDGTTLYCASTDDGDIHLVDVSDPANPVAHGAVGDPRARIHDMYVGGGVAVGCFMTRGFAFLDVSDPDAPTMGPFIDYPGATTHNAWPSDDGQYLFTTDETANGHLRIWDISDPAVPVEVAAYVVDPGAGPHAMIHNVRVAGDLAYIGWYEAGVVVLDVSDPTAPLLVGWFDTYLPPTQGVFAGAWSAAPKGDLVFVSDFTSGLFVLRLVTDR